MTFSFSSSLISVTLVIRLKVARMTQPAELGWKLHKEIVFWKGSPGQVCEVYLRGPGRAYRLTKAPHSARNSW